MCIGNWCPRNYGGSYSGSVPLAVALAVTAVDVLPDHSPKEARAIALQVGLNRVFEHADQAAVALRDIEEMDRFAPHAPHRTARERLLAACAEYLETATRGEA